jgi:hypothetical protein
MSRKHSCYADYKHFNVVNPTQIVQRKLDNFEKAIECNNWRATL